MSHHREPYILSLIDKLFKGSITLEEKKKLLNFFINNQKIKHWPKELGNQQEVEEKIFNRIKLQLNQNLSLHKPTKVIPFYRKKLFKYAAVACISILMSLPFVLHQEKGEVKNTIISGTDKATLTLENGQKINLEKGNTYTNKYANSNGEKIIYTPEENKTPEIIYNYITIPRGGQYHIVLSDNTQVWLNSESQLKYPVQFIKGKPREVELVYGEAYFEVSPSHMYNGSKFLVLNNRQTIEVLGTKFNIKAYKDEDYIYTTLAEGRIAVLLQKDSLKSIPIEPGYQMVLNLDNKFNISPVNIKTELAWVQGRFIFQKTSLEDIAKVLSRWYAIEIKFEEESLKSKTFNGQLSRNQNLEIILELIKNTKKIKSYKIKGKTVFLK